MLWIKAFHIIFAVSWYAGLLYLPRLFVYHADCADEPGKQRFQLMERRLFNIMTIGGTGAILLGLWLLHTTWATWSTSGWLHTKLALVAVLIAFHGWCALIIRTFRAETNRHSARFFRLMNELPALILVGIVILAVVKPSA
ncbi:MAG: protoporphyrinogen oxidase HemJ [Gammaproteobacteria bacterium]|nr:protoporphyrinogen oxidase HemJ [Gammaproteobacteria bacterium]